MIRSKLVPHAEAEARAVSTVSTVPLVHIIYLLSPSFYDASLHPSSLFSLLLAIFDGKLSFKISKLFQNFMRKKNEKSFISVLLTFDK
jgi:hypothetical protein